MIAAAPGWAALFKVREEVFDRRQVVAFDDS